MKKEIETEVEIRNSVKEDFNKIHHLIEQVHQIHVEHRPDIYKKVNPLEQVCFEQMIEDRNNIILVAQIEKKIVGLCSIKIKSSIELPILQPRKISVIDNLCVHESFRGCGIGKKLLNAAKECSKQAGANVMELMVWSFNQEAVKFYEKFGMKERSKVMELEL